MTKPQPMSSKNGIHFMSVTDLKSVFSYLHLPELSFLSLRAAISKDTSAIGLRLTGWEAAWITPEVAHALDH